jgi:hypothetical protein
MPAAGIIFTHFQTNGSYQVRDAGTVCTPLGTPGAAIGGLTILFKKSNTYSINGDSTKWKKFQLMGSYNKLFPKSIFSCIRA